MKIKSKSVASVSCSENQILPLPDPSSQPQQSNVSEPESINKNQDNIQYSKSPEPPSNVVTEPTVSYEIDEHIKYHENLPYTRRTQLSRKLYDRRQRVHQKGSFHLHMCNLV